MELKGYRVNSKRHKDSSRESSTASSASGMPVRSMTATSASTVSLVDPSGFWRP